VAACRHSTNTTAQGRPGAPDVVKYFRSLRLSLPNAATSTTPPIGVRVVDVIAPTRSSTYLRACSSLQPL
jgi:hypothetical protein